MKKPPIVAGSTSRRRIISGRTNTFPFYFHQPTQASNLVHVPASVTVLGRNPVKYAKILIRLGQAGNIHAKAELRVLLRAIQKTNPSRDCKSLQPHILVHLHPSAHWKADRAAELALELLLWLDYYQDKRKRASIRFGDQLQTLPAFDQETANQWWKDASFVFTDTYRKPEACAEFLRLVTNRRAKGDPTRRHVILRKIRDRFCSFAPPASEYCI